MFQAGVDTKLVKEVTGHTSDAVNQYQLTSNLQKEEVSNIVKGESKVAIKPKKVKTPKTPEKVTPSLELSVKSKSPKGECDYQCNSKRQKFDLGETANLSMLINELVSKRKSVQPKLRWR